MVVFPINSTFFVKYSVRDRSREYVDRATLGSSVSASHGHSRSINRTRLPRRAQVVGHIDTALVATHNNEVIAFDGFVVVNGGRMSAVFNAFQPSHSRVLVLSSGPNHMFRSDCFSASIDVKDASTFLI